MAYDVISVLPFDFFRFGRIFQWFLGIKSSSGGESSLFFLVSWVKIREWTWFFVDGWPMAQDDVNKWGDHKPYEFLNILGARNFQRLFLFWGPVNSLFQLQECIDILVLSYSHDIPHPKFQLTKLYGSKAYGYGKPPIFKTTKKGTILPKTNISPKKGGCQ